MGTPMPVQRKVFRIEEQARPRAHHDAPRGPSKDAAPERAFMAELQSLRALIEPQPAVDRDALERARAQIAEAQAFKHELCLIHAAVEQSKGEMSALHTDAERSELGRASRELSAIVGGTERATQAILRAAEVIDHAAGALSASLKSAHDKGLASDIQERVIQIFEACNFQDITGQRVANVVTTLNRIENHIASLREVWRQVQYIAPPTAEDANKEPRLLNGPKLPGDRGHSGQADIDLMFRSG
jgi:chemotaxis protein CheZ